MKWNPQHLNVWSPSQQLQYHWVMAVCKTQYIYTYLQLQRYDRWSFWMTLRLLEVKKKKKKYKWIFTRGNAESPVWLGVLERTKLKTKNRSELLLINYMWQLKRIKGTKLCHDNKNKHININKTIKVDRTEWWRNSKLLHTLTCTRITNDPAGKVTVVNPTIYF